MQAYLNNPQLKEDFVAEIRKHQKADQFLQGTYGEGRGKNFKGCAVGCSIESLNRLHKQDYSVSDHEVYESELGLPEWLARLEDTIFEGLTVDEAKKWPLQFSEAIPVGADLEPVKWKFCAFILSRNIERVLMLDIDNELKDKVVSAIRGVLKVHETAISTGDWDNSAAYSAADSADSAAYSAARSAYSAAYSAARSAYSAARLAARSADSAADSAAYSAAYSAARSAYSAAYSAARSADSAAYSAAYSAARSADSAARLAEFTLYAAKLIELLKAA